TARPQARQLLKRGNAMMTMTSQLRRRSLLSGMAALGIAAAMPRDTRAAAAGAGNYIDTHIHPIGGEMGEVLKLDAYDAANNTKIEPSILNQMDEAGTSMSLLSMGNDVGFRDAAKEPGGARKLNDRLAKMVSDHPTRLRFFACLPMPDMDACLREVEYGI